MSKSKLFFITILSFLTCASAAMSVPKFYAGASIGYGAYDTTKGLSSVTTKTDNLTYGVLGGALWQHSQFRYGAELAYNQYGKKKWDTTQKGYTMHSNTLDLNGVLRYYLPTVPALYFEGQLGGSYVSQKTTFNEKIANTPTPGPDIAGSKSGLFPDLGLGIGYTLINRIALSLNYQFVFANNTSAPMKQNATGGYATKDEFNKVATLGAFKFNVTYQF